MQEAQQFQHQLEMACAIAEGLNARMVNCGHPEPIIVRADGRTEAVEAVEAGKNMFGLTRVQGSLASNAGVALDDVADGLVACVERFHGKRALEDDLTLVLIRQVDDEQ